MCAKVLIHVQVLNFVYMHVLNHRVLLIARDHKRKSVLSSN